MSKKAIVLCADNGYLEQLEVVIKSVCVHNKDIKFYIFHDGDIPSEWFQVMEWRLKQVQSEIVNIRISSERVREYSTPQEFIRYNTFFRYFIGEYVYEKVALYLDCDTLVLDSLEELFAIDMAPYHVAAVTDAWDNQIFNAGVMLVNVERWRDDSVAEQLLSLSDQFHETAYGDQGILNLLFSKEKWLELPKEFNVLVGFDFHVRYLEWAWYKEDYSKVLDKPRIVHFAGPNKPWKQYELSRYREEWWLYKVLEWSEIIRGGQSFSFQDYTNIQAHTAVFTNSADMIGLREMVEALPEVHFHILAYSYFASWLDELKQFSNISFYPAMIPFQERMVLDKLDFYLDINYYDEIADITNRVHELGKPIFAFYETSHDSQGKSYLYENNAVEDMIRGIRTYLGN